jgi:hypothetical protein
MTPIPNSDVTPISTHAATDKGHWPAVARVWEQLSSPLRPSAEDIGFVKQELEQWALEQGAPRAVILGVTPEWYHLPWPVGTDLTAIDHTQAMIDYVWPGVPQQAIHAEWTGMPLSSASQDIALCDGGFHLLSYPDGQSDLVRNLNRIISPNGRCVIRLYVPPQERESSKTVLKDLCEGKISSLNILKLRLGMSMQVDATSGVALKNVWNAINEVAPNLEDLASRIGWSCDHIRAIGTYKDSPNRYHFVSLDTVCELFCYNPGGFTLKTIYEPSYELGHQCPTVVFQRIAN